MQLVTNSEAETVSRAGTHAYRNTTHTHIHMAGHTDQHTLNAQHLDKHKQQQRPDLTLLLAAQNEGPLMENTNMDMSTYDMDLSYSWL